MPITSKLLWKNIEYPWQRLRLEKVENAEAIVVLSGGGAYTLENDIDLVDWNDYDRFIAGINLFKNQKATKIIFTNGDLYNENKFFLEGDIYTNEAIKLGVPSKSILRTGKVFKTLDEARVIKTSFSNLFNDNNKIILVTSAFHMTRAKKIFERNNFHVIPYPVDFKFDYSKKGEFKRLTNYIPSPQSISNTSRVFREYLGRIVYKTF